ncbi:hypothetical protein BOTBODRAFT_104889 [Botryobasidium botryosum FD-172 SS1]|uniref:Endonuclease/exonuclease/phosphatase domain-containing protein n=1 Tax=Botryobasidium botryosum (strain FD-172 SS1) TaxID=930990 RepID=A0A067MQX3_BOTB1|nr:hypothetical protein BOTBODRAFT_104889 [Botryobasidium botryosum FD-172 SS1]
MPTNKVLPTTITFPPPTPGTIKIAAWNVAGLAACQKKGFKHYVEAEDADILILTETKVNNVPVDPSITARYPHCSWSIATKKGYAGTAILSKHKPIGVSYTLPGYDQPDIVKGRIVTLEFAGCWLIGTYVPNAGEGLKTLPVKEAWNVAFEAYIRTLDATKPVIWTGDLNCAPTSKDIRNAKTNWNKTAGFTESECSAFARILNPTPASPPAPTYERLVDTWREMHPDDEHYTYFSYRFNARTKGLGWRLDMFVVSERLFPRVKTSEMRYEIWGASDHIPIILELEGEL